MEKDSGLIQIVVSRQSHQWQYRMARSGLDRVIRHEKDLHFHATVPIEGTPRSARWEVGLRFVTPQEAEDFEGALLHGKINEIEHGGAIVAIRVLQQEVMVSRGYPESDLEELATRLNRHRRHLETLSDGTAVDLMDHL